MKQKRRTKRLLALALLLASVLGLAWASQITSVSVAGPNVQTGITMVPGTVAVGTEVENAVRQALSDARVVLPTADCYSISALQKEDRWLFVSVVGLKDLDAGLGWNLDNAIWAGLILLCKDEDGRWTGAAEGTVEFSVLLADVPESILGAKAKQDLNPLQRLAITSGYRFPWQSGTSMQYGPFGVHDAGFISGWKAVDFLSDGNTGAGHAPDRLLAAASGSISYVCNDGTSVAIRIGDLLYAHLLYNSNLTIGHYFNQGEEMGQLRPGSFSGNCGWADQGANWFHVHWGFPNTGTFEAGGWTLNLSDGLWRRGGETRGINSWFLAEDGGPTPPAAPSNLSASTTGQTSIHLSWSDNSNNEDGFKIFRNSSQIATVGAGSTSYDDNGLSCGTTYSYYVKAYNSAGDSDPSNTDSATTDDCSPPSAPSLNSPCNDQQLVSCADITFDWDESSGATQYQAKYWDGGSDTSDWMSGTSWNVGTLSPGAYSWQARAKNEWGESDWSDTCSFTVNSNQAPNTPSPQSPGDGAWVNSRTVTLQWQDNGDPDNCPRDYRTYNAEISRSGWSNSASDHSGTSWQVTVPSDDDYQWRVQAYDGDLTSGWSGYRTVRVDATPPDTSITSGPSGVIPTGSATFTWTGSDNRTSTGDLVYSYRLVGLSNDWSSWSSATSVTYNDLTDGDYTFEVKAKDKAVNEDPSPASRSFGVDVTPPETTITAGPSGCIGTADVTFTWTGSDNRTPTAGLLYSFKLEGFDAGWSAWTSATSKSYTGLPDGNYTFKVKARDGVGHEDPSPAAQSFRVDITPPTGSILVNSGDSTTNKIAVHLDITGDDGPVGCGVTEMRLSNDSHNWEAWQPFAMEGEWRLPTLNRTTWTVHLQLKDLVGNVSEAFTDDIYLDLYPPRPSSENYQLGARVLASADPTSSSESYGLLSATMGQPIADGRLQGADYHLESGYQGAWPSVPRGRPVAESYDINPSVTASSGGYQASESYRLQGTMGQCTDPGPRKSQNYQLVSGYWGQPPRIEDRARITGAVTLEGRPDPPTLSWSIPVTLTLYLPGSDEPAYVFTPTTDMSGTFSVSGITRIFRRKPTFSKGGMKPVCGFIRS